MGVLHFCLLFLVFGAVVESGAIQKQIFLKANRAKMFLRQKRGAGWWGGSAQEEVEELREHRKERQREFIETIREHQVETTEENSELFEEMREVHAWLREANREYPSLDSEERVELKEETREVLGDDVFRRFQQRLRSKTLVLVRLTNAFVDNAKEATTKTISSLQKFWKKLKKYLKEAVEFLKGIIDIGEKLKEFFEKIFGLLSKITKKLPKNPQEKAAGQKLKVVWEKFIPLADYNSSDIAASQTQVQNFLTPVKDYCDLQDEYCDDDVTQMMISETEDDIEAATLKTDIAGILAEIDVIVGEQISDLNTAIHGRVEAVRKMERLKEILEDQERIHHTCEEKEMKKAESRDIDRQIENSMIQINMLNFKVLGLQYKDIPDGNMADKAEVLGQMGMTATDQLARVMCSRQVNQELVQGLQALIGDIEKAKLTGRPVATDEMP